jgi:hypothetical protein
MNMPVEPETVKLVETVLALRKSPRSDGNLAFWPVMSRAVLGWLVKLRLASPEPRNACA